MDVTRTPQDSMNELTDKSVEVFNEVREFLEALWGLYTSDEPLWFEVFCLNDEGKKIIKFFEGPMASWEVANWLEKKEEMLRKGRYHVYFGVLPRERKPERGRGSARDVERGLWLWADLDFKEPYDSLDKVPLREEARKVAQEQGYWYEELEDHALVGVYRSGSKWVYVNRPPLTKVIEEVRAKLGTDPTIVVDSGAGYHLYFKLSYELGAAQLRVLEEKVVDLLGADPQSKDLARVLRLPGSINPRLNRYVKVIKRSTAELEPPLLKERPREETPQLGVVSGGLRTLSDSELTSIKEAIKDAWVEGHRQYLALFLSGWFAKAKVHPVSVAKLFRWLAEERGDNELEERLSTIYYSYKKTFGNIPELNELDRLIEEWKGEGVLRRGVSKAISKEVEERVKGRSGVQEILEDVLGEVKALEVIRRIEEILGASSPFRDSIFELRHYEKQIYAVANLRKLIMVRARREGNRIVYLEVVAPVAPTKVVVYVNPLGGVNYKYEVTFEGRTLIKPLKVGPATAEEIVAKLKAEGLVYHSRLINDVLNAIIQGFIRKGKAEIKEEVEAPGFYLIDGKVIAVRWEPKEVSKEELREALELLNELANWFRHVLDRFATVIKWYVVSPFMYIYKQKKKWVKALYLYGPPDTGKSTLSKIGASIWGLPLIEKPGSAVSTPARLERVLSSSTFPVMIKEPGEMLERNDVVEMIKSAIEDVIARGRVVRNTYIEIPALAPLVFTSNKYAPRDPGLLKRLILMVFSYGEKIPLEKQKVFEEKVETRFSKLSPIGYWVARKIVENPKLLDLPWKELSTKLLKEVYEEVGLTPPSWIDLWYNPPEGLDEELREAVRRFLFEKINTAFSKHVGRVAVYTGQTIEYLGHSEIDPRRRVEIVLDKKLIPWLLMKGTKVILTTEFRRKIEEEIGDIGGLRSIAELLGWTYQRNFKLGKRNIQVILVDYEDFVNFLLGE